MRFARWTYLIAGAYGVLLLVPGYFLESKIDAPPLNHPEFYYAFYGCALAWQFAFLLIASNPVRWRALMPVTFFEKVSFFAACLWLYAKGRLGLTGPFFGGMIDGFWMVMFIIAWLRTPKSA